MADKTIIINKEDVNNLIHPTLWFDWLETLGVDSEADHVCLSLSLLDENEITKKEKEIKSEVKKLHGWVEANMVNYEANFTSSENAKSFEKWCEEKDIPCSGITSEHKRFYVVFKVI